MKNSLLYCLISGFLLYPATKASAQTAHEEIDLGLSVNWSTEYLDPEMNSDNLTYGYFWATPYYVAGANATPYVPADVNIGTNIAATNYDPAAISWGDGWRLPTKEECDELATLKVEYTTVDGKSGFKVTAENGNSIFFEKGWMSTTIGYNASFWTADIYLGSEESTDYSQAYACNISIARDIKIITELRTEKLWIRPVRDKKSAAVPVSEVTLNVSDITLQIGENTDLYPKTLPVNASNRIVSYSSSDENVATVDALGKVTAVGAGSATISATATDGSGVKGECKVTVPDLSEGQEVDLGLTMIWAAYNVGATSMTDIGTYYQFANPAEVEKWSATVSPYKDTLVLPVTDMAGTQYDPATVNMGSEWSTPSQEQFNELIENCEIVNVSGGYELTSKINGAKLFLPASGYMYVSALNARNDGYYMTAVANDNNLISATVPCAKFSGKTMVFQNSSVTRGVPVRAVKKKMSGLNEISDDSTTVADIYNLMGVKVLSKADMTHSLDLAPGVYIVRYDSGKTKKIHLK